MTESLYAEGWQFLGRHRFCGNCRNPWNLTVARCPGWNDGRHDVWRLR